MSGKRVRIIFPLVAGLVVLVLLLPWSGIDPFPPECYSILGYVVPCGGGFAPASAIATAFVVWLGFFAVHRFWR
ncbi:MAG: hypothetical protein WD184_03775 [Acidimicrobiia bacterium]